MLVVDDTEINRQALCRQLAVFGMEVTAVADGVQAIAALDRGAWRGQPFDLALIDLMMPEVDGDALARRIRFTLGMTDLRLVIVSSVDRDALPPEVAQVADAVLTKPVREQTLVDTLGRLFGAAIQAEPVRAAPAPAPNLPCVAPMRILVAEDNKINQRLMIMLLDAGGHQVDVVGNGAEAVEAVRHGGFDLVLMDMQMPVLDGVGAYGVSARWPSRCARPPSSR